MKLSRESGMASVAVLIALSALVLSTSKGQLTGSPTATVSRRDFSDTIVETGTLSTEQVRLYSSEVTGTPAKLTSLVPEGTTVAAGDVLARLDVAGLAMIRDRARAELDQADAEIRRAQADAEIDTLRSATDIEAASRLAETADRALVNQTQGKGVVDAAAAETAFNDAARELSQAKATAADMAQLLKEGFVTRVEVDRADQALKRAEDQQRLAAARRDALLKFEAPANISRAESEAKGAAANVARQQAAGAARVREREADIAVAISRRDQLRLNIASLGEQIDHGTIRAAAPGMVIYRELYFGAERRKPQIGDEIVAGQPIIAIPDFSAITVETSVREIDLHRIASTNRVSVHVDAYPNAAFPARVSFVGALAQADAARAGAKFFPITVAIAGKDARLRSGMTARVEISVTTLPSALVVPVIAVFDDGGGRYVFVAGAQGPPERRAVVVAAENGSFAAISSGLADGERVLLAEPNSTVKR